MDRSSDEMPRRQNVVELTERIDRLHFRLVARKRKSPYRSLVQRVIGRLRDIQLVQNQRAADAGFGDGVPHPSKAAASDAEVRNRVFQRESPFVSPTLRRNRDNA